MALNFDGLELTDEQKAKIQEQNKDLLTKDDLDKEVAGLKAKRDELLASQAEEKEKKRKAEEQAEQARIDALGADKKYKEQAEAYQKKIAAMEEENKERERKAQELKADKKALELASTLADGVNAELLSTFLRQRLKIEDGEIKVTDSSGALTINTLEDLANEFKSNTKYASLINATRASGGGGAPQKTETKSIASDTSRAIDMDKAKEKIAANLEKQGLQAKIKA